MAEWNEPLPEWNAGGIKPPQSKKDDGWKEQEKPPAQWHNWWMNTTYLALQEVRAVIDGLSASDIGAETPSGAQSKADTAEQNANDYTDQQISNVDAPVDSVNGQTGEVTLDKNDVGLGNVTNDEQATKTEFDAHSSEKASQSSLGHIMVGAGLGIESDGTLSVTQEGVPSGVITMWSGTYSNIPSGWNLCDGNNGTPDLQDRFILGASSESEIGDTGGSHEVTLTEAEMPSHGHSGDTSTDGSHDHSIDVSISGSTYDMVGGDAGGEYDRSEYTDSAGSHSHSLNINSAGGDQAHENRPAFYKLAFIMKA
ncbi:hypothetical protein [Salibacterium sp. K-3]